jgi:hypothetical protein
MKRWYQPLLYLWASPNTLLGLTVIPITLLQGGRARLVRGVVEAQGGVATALLRYVLGAAAVTLGHVVLGRDQQCLDDTREHERVHVRQYERWGPFFLPAYFLSSFLARLRGQHPYLDNHFEREAFDEAG